MQQGGKMSRESTSYSSPSPPPLDAPAHLQQQIQELQLQLLVTTKSLNRARQAMMDKEDEIDEMELQLQRVKSQLNGKTRDKLNRSLSLTDALSISTRRGSPFMARTQELLEASSSDALITLPSKRFSGALSSLGIDEQDDDFDDKGISQLK